ncbi:HEAT repeat domain-containing protein, partial [Candidatus Dependentiae bacterium]|nr:HEAT repeat domain-containing protein [Candidatus Dependentiae bacterium]
GKFLYGHHANFKREDADSMSGLCDIALDDSGNIYAIDRYANQIKKNTLIKKTISPQPPEVRLKKLMTKPGGNVDNEELLNTIRQLNRTTDPETIKNLINTFPKVLYFTQDYRLEEVLILTLASIGEPAIPFLIKALENPNREVRLSVIRVLILNNNQTVIIPLMNCLKKSSKNDGTNWTGYIIRVLLKIDNIPIKSLLEILKDDDKRVQSIGITVLRTSKYKEVISPLIIEMKKNPRFRSKFADALGAIGDKKAIPYLIEILKSE